MAVFTGATNIGTGSEKFRRFIVLEQTVLDSHPAWSKFCIRIRNRDSNPDPDLDPAQNCWNQKSTDRHFQYVPYLLNNL